MNEQNTSTQIVRTEGFNAIETRQNAEMAAIAMSAKVRAEVEAMCIMAERHPRNWLNTRARLLDECKRPGFCEAARYALPRAGTTITGFTIRFAEAALRYMSNMSAGSEVIYEDDEKQVVKVTVRDYEANVAIDSSVMVPKRIEKRFLKKGEKPLSSRINSYGETVYTVPATDDEIAMKHNSLVSKSMRNAVLRMLPGDIADECEEAIAKLKEKGDTTDPMAATKKVVDSFSALRVMPDQLEQYVGHSLENLSPKELDELRGLRVAIKDGLISWNEALESKLGTGEVDEKATERNATVAEAMAKAQAKLDAKKQKQAPAAAQPATPPAEPMRDPGQEG